MYSAHNEGKPVVAERFIRTFKSKTCKYMTSISENEYIRYLVNKYNNAYHRIIKVKPIDVKDNTFLILVKKLMIKNLNLKLMIM